MEPRLACNPGDLEFLILCLLSKCGILGVCHLAQSALVGVEPRALCMLSSIPTTELHPIPSSQL